MKKILFLYAELMPYNIPVIREIIASGYDLHIVRWDKNRLTAFVPPEIDGVTYYDRSAYSGSTLYQLVKKITPCLVYVSGWMDNEYCIVSKKIRKMLNIPVIAGCDTQWRGGRQWINVIFSRFRHQRWFSHIQVAGFRQYEYAHRLGFFEAQILTNLYSADSALFGRVNIEAKKDNYPKRLIFIGRYAEEKGVAELIHAWKSLNNYNGWSLKIIGDGPLRSEIEQNLKGVANVELGSFLTQEEIVSELQDAGFFILPSKFEPWALVIHEAACAGLPIMCTSVCGASNHFVVNGYNGFIIEPEQKEILKGLKKIISLKSDELLQFSYRSRELSNRISPEVVANSILSTLR